ncbi:hypothetical protein GGR16_000968 [Chelatococcus caeni]|uniref:Uncharacterized protein n=1 Tax=Chelatococcus caeni TaxID=1348468 RepID=A0A840BW73_9HYPH|nr:hypothetical protein [Chelatococcus caeni]MBB4015962.1 hypothetical protein [Chelatococcus caeni]
MTFDEVMDAIIFWKKTDDKSRAMAEIATDIPDAAYGRIIHFLYMNQDAIDYLDAEIEEDESSLTLTIRTVG